MNSRYRFFVVGGVLLCTLAGSYWGQRTAAAASAAPQDFLHPVSLPGWTYTETKLGDHERDLLKPDAVLLRNYQSPTGEAVQLAVIAGHRKQTVHTPAFCMTGGGWTTISNSDWATKAGDTAISGTQAVMMQQGQQLLASYFFTDGTYCTQSLPRFQAEQFMQRLRGQMPMGALVRIIVPVQEDQAAAEWITNEFARAVLPDVLHQIQQARMH